MKKLLTIACTMLVIAMACVTTSCNTKTETTQTATTTKTGNIIFWTDSQALVPITVTLNGETKEITNYCYSEPTSVDYAVGCAVFKNVTPGNYSFTATHENITWPNDPDAKVTATAGGISKYKLYVSK